MKKIAGIKANGETQTETLVVDMSIKNATKKELKILSNFYGVSISPCTEDYYNITYTIYIDYLNTLKNRLEAVLELMENKKNKITVSTITKLQAQALTIYRLCDKLIAAKITEEAKQ